MSPGQAPDVDMIFQSKNVVVPLYQVPTNVHMGIGLLALIWEHMSTRRTSATW